MPGEAAPAAPTAAISVQHQLRIERTSNSWLRGRHDKTAAALQNLLFVTATNGSSLYKYPHLSRITCAHAPVRVRVCRLRHTIKTAVQLVSFRLHLACHAGRRKPTPLSFKEAARLQSAHSTTAAVQQTTAAALRALDFCDCHGDLVRVRCWAAEYITTTLSRPMQNRTHHVEPHGNAFVPHRNLNAGWFCK